MFLQNKTIVSKHLKMVRIQQNKQNKFSKESGNNYFIPQQRCEGRVTVTDWV